MHSSVNSTTAVGSIQSTFISYQDASAAARLHAGRVARGEVSADLLTTRSAKMDKSGGAGFVSVVLHLQPAGVFDGLKTCPWATAGCIQACLGNAGRMRFGGALFARLWRTWLLIDHRDRFFEMLLSEIRGAQKRAGKKKLGFTARLNGTSDLSWETMLYQGRSVFEHLPNVTFYDYTKSPDRPLEVQIPNYHLVYSHNEDSDPTRECEILDRGGSVAMVLDIKKESDLPEKILIGGKWYPVINGDVTDLRHLDPRGVVVGLKYKLAFNRKTGKAITPPKGFVVKIGRSNVWN